MSNYGIKIDLLKLAGSCVTNLQGKTATKKCVVIPIEDNDCIFHGQKGVYLDLTAFEMNNHQYGETHLIKGDIPKDKREKMTEEQRRALPILGGMKELQRRQVETAPAADAFAPSNDDDMPF